MTADHLLESLIAASPASQYAAVLTIPGAGIHAQVLRFSSSLRGSLLDRIASLSETERASFVKALAVFENTVGGLGSVTALHRVLPLVKDDNQALIDWVLSNTKSYWYYSHGAKSFAELQEILALRSYRRAENEQLEHERKAAAKIRKAHCATEKLYNAVRRGDAKAVEALLSQGASPGATTPEGVPLAQYAEAGNRADIAEKFSKHSINCSTD
jgi:hypothetical protein